MRLTLTKRGEYGIRIVLRLADLEDGERMTAHDLADVCAVPAGNVPTIVNVLTRAGILASTPGRGGGCALARDAADISMLEVIEALEGPLEISRCLLDTRRCHDKDPECAVHQAWSSGRDAAIASLKQTSIAQTAAREREIQALLAGGGAKRGARAARARR